MPDVGELRPGAYGDYVWNGSSWVDLGIDLRMSDIKLLLEGWGTEMPSRESCEAFERVSRLFGYVDGVPYA